MTAYTNPQTVVLRTDKYRLDIRLAPWSSLGYSTALVWPASAGAEEVDGDPITVSYDGVTYYPHITPFFQWLCFRVQAQSASTGRTNDFAMGTSPPSYSFNHFTIECTVNLTRTYTIGDGGLSVVDAQVIIACSYTLDDVDDSSYTGSGSPTVPSSFSYSYTSEDLAAAGSYGPLCQANCVVANIQPVSCSVDLSNTFLLDAEVEGIGLVGLVQKLDNSQLIAYKNEGGSVDPQASASEFSGEIAVGQCPFQIIYYYLDPYPVQNRTEGTLYYYNGVNATDFGLLLNRPNVPLGTLACSANTAAAFPVLPALSLSGTSRVILSSAAANVQSWGGFRYLKCKAYLNGFSSSEPMPRILMGIVETSKATEAVCSAALSGDPSAGVWYELELPPSANGSQPLTIDLARPISGSSFSWVEYINQIAASEHIPAFYSETNPLGVGISTINVETPIPGTADTIAGVPVPQISLVLCLDSSKAVLAGAVTNVQLSAFSFADVNGSTLAIRVNSQENNPKTKSASAQPNNIDVNSAVDGTLIKISRDGKPSLAVSTCAAGTSSGDDDAPPYNGTGAFTWADMLAGFTSNPNGYEWSFEPLYSNFMTGGEEPFAFLPVPTKWPAKAIPPGGSVNIPVAARCTSYTNNCPWAPLGMNGVITGDDPVIEDKCAVELLCLSDYLNVPWNLPVTVQSGVIGTAGLVALSSTAPAGSTVPAPTSDFPATVITPDENGVVMILDSSQSWTLESLTADVLDYGVADNVDAYVTFEQYEISPQIDGFICQFDEALAKGATVASGSMQQVFVPVRNGQLPPIVYTPTTDHASPAFTVGPNGFLKPYLDRATSATLCVRESSTQATKYSEPRNGLWQISSDNKGRLVATLLAGYSPYSTQVTRLIKRSGAYIIGFYPALCINEAQMIAVYRRSDSKWVYALTNDQFVTLGSETVIFNQTLTGLTRAEYDQATCSQWYVGSTRADGLSWLTTPEPSTNPGALNQAAVIRRRDNQGNSLPFVPASGAALAAPIWENILFIDQPNGGSWDLMVLPTGTVVIAGQSGTYSSSDNGTTWTDDSGAAVQSLSTQTSGELAAGADGGMENP